MTPPWLSVIGLGEDGLAGVSDAARALIDDAELLVGGTRHLALVPPGSAARLVWDRPLLATLPRIAEWRGRKVAVLASGDPMCYGVGVTLTQHFNLAEMNILPRPSAFSLAAARLGWDLANCATLTVHGRPLDAVRLHLAPGRRLLILSEDGTTPGKLAWLLASSGWGPSVVTVLSHIGGPGEERVSALAGEWGDRICPDLNTIALECRPAPGTRLFSRGPGLPDDAFRHDGQLTKREIRAVTLAALGPQPGETLWDVGAGCGSIAIEWLRAVGHTEAVAIERKAERCGFIAGNAATLGVPHLRIVEGEAPDALSGLPAPQAIFLGGGLTVPGLLDHLWGCLPPGGRLVANAVTVDGEARLAGWQALHGGALTRLAISRAAPVGGYLGWRPLMPVTQLAAIKEAGAE